MSISDRRLQRLLREAVSIPVQASSAFNYEQTRDELNLEHNITPNESRMLCPRSIIGKVSFVREIQTVFWSLNSELMSNPKRTVKGAQV